MHDFGDFESYEPSEPQIPYPVKYQDFRAESGICTGNRYMWTKPDSKGGIQTMCSDDIEVLKVRIIQTYAQNFSYPVSVAPGAIVEVDTGKIVYFQSLPPGLNPYGTMQYQGEKKAWEMMQQAETAPVEPAPSGLAAMLPPQIMNILVGKIDERLPPNWVFLLVAVGLLGAAGVIYNRRGK